MFCTHGISEAPRSVQSVGFFINHTLSILDFTLKSCSRKKYQIKLNFVSESLHDPEIQRVAVMVLGALAGNMWTAGYESQAEAIVVKIEDKLGVHGKRQK